MNNEKPSRFSTVLGNRRFRQVALISLAAIVLVIALFAVFGGGNGGVAYRTDPVTRGDVQKNVTATGTVNPVTTVQVGTQVSGAIKFLFADFNSRVKKGQIIAQIDPAFYETQLAQSQANADRAQAALRDAERLLNQNKTLFARNLVAKNDYDAAETNYASAKAQLA
jgi:HlyD family secretion protein